jgi:ribosome recycling factor
MDEMLKPFESKMEKTLANLTEEYAVIRAGRANPQILNKIMVSYYGTDTPLQQVASISVPEARMIQIQPWDRGLIKEIEKAINKSDIGINPNNDGQVIRLIFPELTEERRKELSKDIRKKGEEAKVAVRNIRRDAMEKLKRAEKAGELTEDDLKQNEEDAQKLTDDFIKKIDAAVAEKTKEVMKV